MRLALVIFTALLVLAVPSVASAAPDRTATLSAASPSFNWSPEPASGAYFTLWPASSFDPAQCSKDAETYCDQTLVKFEAAPGSTAKLDITLDGFTAPQDFDLYLYRSDASGALGEEVEGDDGSTAGAAPGEVETLIVDELAPGHYLIVVAYYFVEDATFNGTAKVTGAVPVPGGTTPPSTGPTPAPPSTEPTPPPSSGSGLSELPFKAAKSTLGSARKAKKKRSLKFKVTAERDIENLQVALRKGKKTVGTATLGLLQAGTSKLKLKTAKKIKKGKYLLVAQGTVDGDALSTTQAVKLRK